MNKQTNINQKLYEYKTFMITFCLVAAILSIPELCYASGGMDSAIRNALQPLNDNLNSIVKYIRPGLYTLSFLGAIISTVYQFRWMAWAGVAGTAIAGTVGPNAIQALTGN